MTAISGSGDVYASGLAYCIQSTNRGKITAKTTGGAGAEAFGLVRCEYSTNDADVKAENENSPSGDVKAHGSYSGTVCVNRGLIEANALYSDGLCQAFGTSSGTYDSNYGAVKATAENGSAEAFGVHGDDAQNYASVYASGNLGQAVAHGACGNHTLNEGEVTAKSEKEWGYAEGVAGNPGDVSTGLVWAETSSVFCSRYPQALHSTQTKVTYGMTTGTGKDGEGTDIIYLSPKSTCDIHTNWEPQYMTKVKSSTWCDCMNWCGSAESVAYPSYVMPEVPPMPQATP